MTTADQLAELEAEYDHHVWAMRFHTHEARRLLPMLRMLRAAVAREEANLDKQAKRWMGPETRRSA